MTCRGLFVSYSYGQVPQRAAVQCAKLTVATIHWIPAFAGMPVWGGDAGVGAVEGFELVA